jgi:hypothetical protein
LQHCAHNDHDVNADNVDHDDNGNTYRNGYFKRRPTRWYCTSRAYFASESTPIGPGSRTSGICRVGKLPATPTTHTSDRPVGSVARRCS